MELRKILCVGLLASAACASPQGGGPMTAGSPAPDFSLPGSDGQTYRLSDFRDKQAVVVAWFPAAFTPG